MDTIELEKLARTEQKIYLKEWRAKNRDKVKKHNENYWKNRVLKELEKAGEKHGK